MDKGKSMHHMPERHHPRSDSETISDDTESESFSDLCILRDEVNFIHNMSQFYNQEALSDIIIKLGSQKFYGHKFVLAKSSDVFRTMLYEKKWAGRDKTEIELSESPECQDVFDNFLKYLYTAEVSINTSSAVGILCLADKYNVASLKELCESYMIAHSKSPKMKNALNWYPWAKALNFKDLMNQCTKTIQWNYMQLISSPQWLNLDLEFLMNTICSSELVLLNEYSLWKAVTKWLQHENHVHNLSDYASKLFPLIRFPQMKINELHELEQSEFANRREIKVLVHELLSKAYRFRALCPSQSHLGVSFSHPFYIPRDYIDLTVDSVRMQNTLRFGIQVDVKMYKGPVPAEVRNADWKITYRKQGEMWTLLFYCHETGLIENEARIQPSIIIYNENEQVLQVHREPLCVITRGNTYTIELPVIQPELSRQLAVLIKPMPL